MARTSERHLAIRRQYEAVIDTVSYQTGAYVRLSNDSRAKESESMENQEDMIQDYIRGHSEIRLMKVYRDDGCTGTNFCRDGFRQMMEDVRNGILNCIIVCDLSRFGREHIDVGDYIDKIFPFLGIRFISIRDQYDSLEPDCGKRRLELSIKNLCHDIYPRDVSRNVSNVFMKMQESGECWNNRHAPYGYLINKEEKRYSFDYRTYRIVRKIAGWIIGGCNVSMVVGNLYRRKILPPSIYKKDGKVYAGAGEECKRWNPETIYKMMHNREYTGIRISHKSESRLYLNIDSRTVPEEEWFVHEDRHPAILRPDIFSRIQENFKKISRRDSGAVREKKILPMMDMAERNLVKGKVFCGECHCAMNRVTTRVSVNKEVYQTRAYRCSSRLKDCRPCDTKSIREKELFEIVLEALRNQFQQIVHLEQRLAMLYQASFQDVEQDCRWERNHITNQMVYLEQERRRMFTAFLENEVTKGALEKERLLYESELSRLSRQLEEAEKTGERVNFLKTYWCNMTKEVMKHKTIIGKGKMLDYKSLTAELVQAFVEEIRIYKGNRVEIIFNFEDKLTETYHIFGHSIGEGRAI